MGDNVAVMAGYTEAVMAIGPDHELYLLVKPGTDFESTFKAWDTDNQEWLMVNGWMYQFEKPDQTDWTVYKTDDYAGTVTHHATQAEAEARIAEIEKIDPDGVHNGDYSIDGPTE